MMASPLALILLLVAQQLLGAQPYKDEDVILEDKYSKKNLKTRKISDKNSNCSLVGVGKGLVGSEDLALGRHSILFVTSGDLFGIFTNGPESSDIGGVWMIDPRPGGSQEPVKAEIAGFPAGKKLHIHGFDVSNETDRMFLVNHHSEASSIEVLKHSFVSTFMSIYNISRC